MPVHLPPLSRREFLSRTLVAGAGLMLSPRLFAAARKADPHCWALLSDPHIAADRTVIARGINMTDQLASVINDVLDQPQFPVGALVNGDLAYNNGETADYQAFAGLVERLRAAPMPLHLSLGNHDNRERFWAAMAADKSVERQDSAHQLSIVRSGRANWFMLDSLEKTLVTPGILGPSQLAWLAQSLDANADKPALVMVHHNPAIGASKPGLRDLDELFAVMRPRRQVKAYFFGHTHVWKMAEDPSGIHLVNLPTTAYPFDKVAPTGWVLANLQPNGVRLQLRCIDRTRAEHGQTVDLTWRS